MEITVEVSFNNFAAWSSILISLAQAGNWKSYYEVYKQVYKNSDYAYIESRYKAIRGE